MSTMPVSRSDDGWRIAGFIAIAYTVSRGLAKLGSPEPYTEDRSESDR